MRIFHSLGHVLGGSLLIAGTTIGVGMLALPVVTAPGGFVPAVSIYLICWLFMLCTGLLLLEVCTWMPKDANLITMAHRLLGPVGQGVCWVVYLFLFITVMIAHVAGGGHVLQELTGSAISPTLSMIIYVIAFAPVIYLGAHSVDRLNMCLISGVIITYILFIVVSHSHVNFSQLTFSNWGKAWVALPVLFTAFTYQVIIPTLMTYMERNVKKVRLAILFGTSIPLVIYLVWELLILGIIPINDLIDAGTKGHTAIMPLKQFLQNPTIFTIGKYFAFFTLTTSYVALSLAFFDFLADGLKITKKGIKRVFLCFLVFTPPTIIALINPDIFLKALGYAGGFSCAILFGLYPPIMVWIGRYRKKYSHENRMLPGGKTMLRFLILFVLFELAIEIGQQFTSH